jgi:hypothetical protein
VELEHGASRASGLNWYVAGNLFAEDGWRDDSPSKVGQLFGKLGWHETKGDTSLSMGYADDSPNGNGLQEQRFLPGDYTSVYTKPDETHNLAGFLNLTARRDWTRSFGVSGNVYDRHIRTSTFNGDINGASLDQSNVLLQDEPGENCNGLLNRSETSQHNYGVSGQGTWRDWFRSGNTLTVGRGL